MVDAVGSSVHAIYRLAPTRKSEVRPDWFSQRACVRSFIAAADAARDVGIALRSTVVVDGELDAVLLPELEWFDEYDHIRLRGNSPAFRHALEVAMRGRDEITLFAEDDYMWTADAIVKSVCLLDEEPQATYVSPYWHPVLDDSSARDVRRHRHLTTPLGDVVWQSTPRTTMTFACRTSTLRDGRHYWWLATYGKSPKDSYAFWALLEGRWFKLVGNAAFRDVRRVLNGATLRLVGDCVSRRLRPGRRPVLFQPAGGLATHVHQPFVTGGTDWRALAVAMERLSP